MPTVLNIDAARVLIYPRDHPPEHVHVLEAGSEAILVAGFSGRRRAANAGRRVDRVALRRRS